MKTKNGIIISISNSKLGGFIPSINLPPLATCRADAPCKKECYACKGNYRYQTVKNSMLNNLDKYEELGNVFFDDVIDFLSNGLITYKFFRWHSAGDIVNANYLNGVIKVANACPSTKFLIFTKKFYLINNYLENGGTIPENLSIVFSAWGADFVLDNPYNLPVAFVDFGDSKKTGIIPVTALRCRGNCQTCLTCWNIKAGQATVFKKH